MLSFSLCKGNWDDLNWDEESETNEKNEKMVNGDMSDEIDDNEEDDNNDEDDASDDQDDDDDDKIMDFGD